MKLPAYVSPSRHGIMYFRWPLPKSSDRKRRSVRISLRTKCPDRAGDLARHLASCGRIIRDNKALARLRQDEMRDMVRSYFMASLDRYVEKLNDTGLPDQTLDLMRQELDVHEGAGDGYDDLSELFLDAGTMDSFRASAGLSDAQWTENEPALRHELRKARRDQIKAILSAAEHLDRYSYTKTPEVAPSPAEAASEALSKAVADFMSEHTPQWSNQMANRAQAFLAVMLEHLGSDRPMADISRQDASALKKIVQALPVNRNTRPETRNLPLSEAIKVEGVQKVSVETINNHMAMFQRFGDWAERHGYAPSNVFDRMKVAKPKKPAPGRKDYTYEQTAKLYAELTQNHAGLVKKDDHKWGALLGLFTGARLNEIAQLEVADVCCEDEIWFLNITDDGDDKKRLKANASRRKVPLHSELIKLGFVDWVKSQECKPRLFMSFSYNAKDGYGRNLGRWFNGPFLKGLGMKESGLVFHSLRHTMVERLAKADVPEPLYQDIVGHERHGVTQKYYNKGGHTLAQMREAIERFKV
ncbi:integrase [Thioclava sp. SK-1]|uniref:site-specific integrase n=1 Tax=Thioclava sp. SK-1 TaxID=1889770 RepID=UPI0008249640|nr:site-specific integrase [Thioclava sp. SK-1]OCX66858.1 integrase [Thioclava sp. SK-1]